MKASLALVTLLIGSLQFASSAAADTIKPVAHTITNNNRSFCDVEKTVSIAEHRTLESARQPLTHHYREI